MSIIAVDKELLYAPQLWLPNKQPLGRVSGAASSLAPAPGFIWKPMANHSVAARSALHGQQLNCSVGGSPSTGIDEHGVHVVTTTDADTVYYTSAPFLFPSSFVLQFKTPSTPAGSTALFGSAASTSMRFYLNVGSDGFLYIRFGSAGGLSSLGLSVVPGKKHTLACSYDSGRQRWALDGTFGALGGSFSGTTPSGFGLGGNVTSYSGFVGAKFYFWAQWFDIVLSDAALMALSLNPYQSVTAV